MKLAKTIVFSMGFLLLLMLGPPAGLAGTEDFKFSISDDNMIQVWCPPYVYEVGMIAYIDADMSGAEGTYYYRYYCVGNHSYGRTIKMDVPLDHYYLIDFVYYDMQKEMFIKYYLKEPIPVIFSLEDVKWYGTANMSWHEVNLDWPKNSVSWLVDIDGYDGQGFTYRRHLEFPAGEDSSRHEIITDLPAEGKVTVSMYAKRGGMVSEKTKKTICIPMKPLSGLTGAYTSSNPPTVELKWQPGANRRQDAVEIERTNPDGSKTTIMNDYYEDHWTDDQASGHIEANKFYKYRIRAVSKNDAGYNSAWSDQITIWTTKINPEISQQVTSALLAPADLRATAKSSDRIDLAWVDKTSAETGFAIERTGPDDSVAVLTAPKDAAGYSDTGLLPGSRYTYRVKAVKESESSAFSISDSAATFQLTNLPSEIKVMVNGKELSLDVNPVVVEGRTLVPLRGIFEALGAQVDWNSAERKITARRGDVTILLQIGSKQAFVNGKAVELDVAPDIIGGRTLVPMRFVSEAMGGNVDWDGGSRTASVISVPKTLLDKIKPTPQTTAGTLTQSPTGTKTENTGLLPGTTGTITGITKPAPTIPVFPTTYSLSLEPASVTVTSGGYVEFSGALKASISGSGTQTGLSGKTVTLCKVADGQRTQIGTATTGSGGSFAYKYKPSGSGTFIAVYKDSSGKELAVSSNSVVTVKTLTTIPKTPIRILP